MTYTEKMAELKARAKAEAATASRVRGEVKRQLAEAENRVVFPGQSAAAPARSKQQSMPSLVSIARFWCKQGIFRVLDWGYPGCFACGQGKSRYWLEAGDGDSSWNQARLERCHLVGKADGGNADVSNIVLLCRDCHRRAPMIGSSPQPMIDWINRQEYYFDRNLRRLEGELRAIRPTLPEEAIDLGLNDGEKLTMLLNVAAHSMNIGYHCDGDMFATGAAVLANIVDGLKRG